jgi:hypothetical protein
MSSFLLCSSRCNFPSSFKSEAIHLLSSNDPIPNSRRCPLWFLALDCDPFGFYPDVLHADYMRVTERFPEFIPNANSSVEPPVSSPNHLPAFDSPEVKGAFDKSFRTIRVDLPRGVDFFHQLTASFDDSMPALSPDLYQYHTLRILYGLAKTAGDLSFSYIQGHDRFIMMSLIFARMFIKEVIGRDEIEWAEAIAFRLSHKLLEKAAIGQAIADAAEYFENIDKLANEEFCMNLKERLGGEGSFCFALRWRLVWFIDDYKSVNDLVLIWDQLICREGKDYEDYMESLLLVHIEKALAIGQNGLLTAAAIQSYRDWELGLPSIRNPVAMRLQKKNEAKALTYETKALTNETKALENETKALKNEAKALKNKAKARMRRARRQEAGFLNSKVFIFVALLLILSTVVRGFFMNYCPARSPWPIASESYGHFGQCFVNVSPF